MPASRSQDDRGVGVLEPRLLEAGGRTQATLLAGVDMLHGFAALCLVMAIFVLVQKSFR